MLVLLAESDQTISYFFSHLLTDKGHKDTVI